MYPVWFCCPTGVQLSSPRPGPQQGLQNRAGEVGSGTAGSQDKSAAVEEPHFAAQCCQTLLGTPVLPVGLQSDPAGRLSFSPATQASGRMKRERFSSRAGRDLWKSCKSSQLHFFWSGGACLRESWPRSSRGRKRASSAGCGLRSRSPGSPSGARDSARRRRGLHLSSEA